MDPLDAPTFDPQKTAPRSGLPLLPESLYGQFGKYQIIKKIGQGGMGAVYKAIDPVLQREVAIKVPIIGTQDPVSMRERFSREAMAVAQLRHPAICPVFDFNEFAGIPYIVCPFLTGCTLQEQLEIDGVWSIERTLNLAIQIANGLAEAHRHAIVHRDIKPQNIFLEKDGLPLVLDFGLAKSSLEDQVSWTQTGEVLGTPAYMPPEQIDASVGPIGPTTDVYALGMTIYRSLTGRTAFVGESAYVVPQILMDEPRAPSQIKNQCELKAIDDLVLRSLAKKPTDRFPDMQSFAAEMQSTLARLTEVDSDTVVSYLPGLRILGSQQLYRPNLRQHSIRIGRQRTSSTNPAIVANDLVLRADGDPELSLRISRQHMEILADASGMTVIDRSQAGVTVNGVAVAKGVPTEIKPGDILGVAGVIQMQVVAPVGFAALPQKLESNRLFEATMGDFYRDEFR